MYIEISPLTREGPYSFRRRGLLSCKRAVKPGFVREPIIFFSGLGPSLIIVHRGVFYTPINTSVKCVWDPIILVYLSRH